MPDTDKPRNTGRTDAQANTGAGARAEAQTADRTVRRGAEATEQEAGAAAEPSRRGADAAVTHQDVQAGVEPGRRGGGVTIETLRRSARAMAEGQRRIAQDAARTFEETNRRVAEAARGTSEDMCRSFVLP